MTDEDSADLPTLIRSYLDDDEVALLPNNPAEARTNTWGYSFRLDELDPQEVVIALHEVAATLGERLKTGAGPATFYAWHDQLAGQLRCSLASHTELELPFRNPYVTTVDASLVAESLLSSTTPGLITWSEPRPVTQDMPDADEETDPTLVWVFRLV